MTDSYEINVTSRMTFPLLGDKNFAQWRQRMADQLKELDMWWIVSGREHQPDATSTEPTVVSALNKY